MRQHDRAARLEHGVIGDDHLRHVGHHEHHPVAQADTQPAQRVRHLVHLPVELLVIDRAVVEQDRVRLGHGVRRTFEKTIERLARDRDGVGRLGVVIQQPGPLLDQRGAGGGAAPRGALLALDEALDHAVDGFVPLDLHLMLGPAHVVDFRAGDQLRHVVVDAVGKVRVALAANDQGGRAHAAQQRPAAPLAHVVEHHAPHDVDLGIPAPAIFPHAAIEHGRHAKGDHRGARQRVFACRGDQHEAFQPFGKGVRIFDADRAAERVPDQHEFFGELQTLHDRLQVAQHLVHGVVGIGGVALAVTAQIRHDDAVIAREVVDLIFPRFGAARVAVHEHDRLLDGFRPQIHDRQRRTGDVFDRHADAVQVKVKLDRAVFEAPELSLHTNTIATQIAAKHIPGGVRGQAAAATRV